MLMAAVNVSHDDCSKKSFLINTPDELDGDQIKLPIFFVDNQDEWQNIDLPVWAQWIKSTSAIPFSCSWFKAGEARKILTRIRRPMSHRNSPESAQRLLPNTNWGSCEYFDDNGQAYGYLFVQ